MMKNQKLDKNNVQDILSLSPMQEGILYHYMENPKSDKYFEQLKLRIKGHIKVDLLKEAWQHVCNTNEMLRTIYRWSKLEKPMQIVLKNNTITFIELDISNMGIKEKEDFINDYLKRDRDAGIDISIEPIRISLLKLDEATVDMVISNHHIIYDGWSNGIILKEFFTACNHLADNIKPVIKTKNTYKEYIKWYNNQDRNDQKAYWSDYMQGFSAKTMLPWDKRSQIEESKTSKYMYKLSDNITNNINSFCKNNKLTLATLMYTAWGMLLQQYDNSKDVVFGTTVSGRKVKVRGIEDMVGLFINTLPLRISTVEDEKISSILNLVDGMLKEREDYENTSLVDIKACSELSGTESLFDSIVVIENYPLERLLNNESNSIYVESYSMWEATNFDLTLAISDSEGIELSFIYNEERFYKETIERIASHYQNIISFIIQNQDRKLSEIDYMTIAEKEQLLNDFNKTSTSYPQNKTIQQLFEEQAEKKPDNIAVVFENQQITYKQLNIKANQLAKVLRSKGVKADTIVGILAERSIEMIIGIMAVLKAGGAYAPIDPDYPIDRISYILEDSSTKLLLTQKSLADRYEFKGEVILLDDADIYMGDTSNPAVVNSSDNLAYIMYTSGSTGKPKGNLTNHMSITRVVKNTNYIELNEKDTLLQLSNYAFDGSTFDIFGALLNGAKLVMLNKDSILELDKLSQIIIDDCVTVFFVTTALFNTIVDVKIESLKNVRKVLFGGERVSVQHVRKALEYMGAGKLLHMYGPTESTVYATYYPIDFIDENLSTIPIGKPLSNTEIYILNSKNNLVPIGVVGEICISGDGLVKGYLNRPELTAEKFILNPFKSTEKLYKTGDLAKWLPDGNIEFVGRADHQIKLRGFRIELGEIESQIMKYEGIRETIVVDYQDETGNKYLCAYFSADKDVEAADIRKFLSKDLPAYMVPTYFIRLDRLPLTSNGKINRKALPEPDLDNKAANEYIAPETELEIKLADIWQDVLGVERVGVNDSFFELGGHSLKATALAAKIHKELDMEIPLKKVFAYPTVKEMAYYISNAETDKEESQQNLFTVNNMPEIKPAEQKDYYDLSSYQLSLFIQEQFEGIGISYNMPLAMMVEGSIAADKLEQAFRELIKRHEVFRTSFEMKAGKPVQKIKEEVSFNIDYQSIDENDIEKSINSFIKPFSLDKAPLLRVGLYKIQQNKHLLIIDMHHIISDGVSLNIIFKEFAALYKDEELQSIKLQYKDYAEWQTALLQSDYLKKQELYWEGVLKGNTPVLNMPLDYHRAEERSFSGSTIENNIDSALTKRLNSFSQKQNTTLNTILFAIYNILLNKYSGQDEIVVGSLVAGRRHQSIQDTIGMFNNFLPIKSKINSQLSFSEYIAEINENMLSAYENQEYPYDKMVEKWSVRTDVSRNPLFDTMLILHNQLDSNLSFNIGEAIFTHYKLENNTSKLDFKVDIFMDENESMSCIYEYNTKLFKKETIERLARHFINIAKQVISNPDIKLSQIDILDEIEKQQILVSFNNTKADYLKHKTLHQLFEEKAQTEPDSIAAVFGDQQITYKELNEKANSLARLLRQKGVEADNIVAMMVNRSLEMTIGIMGILKAGGAYLPIGTDYPEDRIRYMLEDSQAKVLLTQSNLIDKADYGIEAVNLDDSSIYEGDSSNLEPISSSKNLAYVIYTSGSTGKPKGAMIEHHSAVNRIKWMQKRYPIAQQDVILQKTPYTFDVSVWELFWWSMEGSAAAFLTPGGEKDPSEIVNAIEKYKVSTMHFVPSMLSIFLEYLEGRADLHRLQSLRQVFASGEALTPLQVERFNRILNESLGVKLINLYGPTEATVDVSYFDCSIGEKLDIIPIGKPIDNIKLLIVNKHNQLVPVGVPGELCISGVGVGRGYLNRAELTAEKFIKNPYSNGEADYEIMYRTGDLTRWMPDGNIEYLGRIDHQVKIRGFRIELGEIENQLLKHEDIQEAVVMARDDKSGSKYLCGYIVSSRELTIAELREHILKDLPEYMVPAYFVRLEKMPLSANGKADRKALPEPDGSIATGTEYVAPRNETEQRLAAIWQDILQVESIGVKDNFFDLGGHSLKATVLIGRVHKEFNIDIHLTEVFKNTTIEQLAELISSSQQNVYSEIKLVEKQNYYPLSSAQKRLYILNKIEESSTNYNLPEVMMIEGKLDIKQMELAFQGLITRHESLRTSFALVNGEPVQIIHDSVDFKIDYTDIAQCSNMGEDEAIRQFIKPFDLNKAPLLRAGIIKLEENRHLLMFDMHHIISDGVSIVVLVKEFIDLYQNKELPELRIQYKDYAEWHNTMLETEKALKHKEYWLNVFSDSIPALNMPTDYARPALQSFEGSKISFALDNAVNNGLRKLSAENGATLYMTLLSIYNVLLFKYTGQEDIAVGSPVVGRPHWDLENLIGMFVNTLAIRNYPQADKAYGQFLREVRQASLEAFENQEYPFEQLVDNLKLNKDLSRNPLFDTMLVLQNMSVPELRMDNLTFKKYNFENKVSKFDITMEAVEKADSLVLNIEYCTKLFKKETIERLAKHFINIAKQVISNPDIKLSQIDILDKAEKQHILKGFNSTEADYLKHKTLHQLFEEKAQASPDSIAAIFGEQKITYKELNEKANSLARLLRQKGVEADNIVAMMVNRSLEMTIGIMGILKAGGAYLPIGTDYPEDRIRYMLEDSQAKVLLTQSNLIDKADYGIGAVNLEADSIYQEDSSNLESISGSKNLAYVIYTSGSTGKPKGAMIEHHSAVNRIKWMQKRYPIAQQDVILQKTPYTFDVSVWELFWWSMEGSAAAFLTPGGEKDPSEIVNAIEKYKVSTMHFVPSMLSIFLEYLEGRTDLHRLQSLRQVFASGEALTPLQVERFNRILNESLGVKLINLYGPTEATVDVSYFDCSIGEKLDIIPIGKPIDNIKLLIVNKHNQLMPIGVPGELCISGVGVGRGYLNRADLTAEKFIKNPYSNGEADYEIMYRTGDLTRWMPDGNIEYLGRIDHQVKIRGFRIELGEIENQLLKNTDIQEAVVMARDDKSRNKYLCGYIVSNRELTIAELREHILRDLPEYMVPAYFVRLEKLPLSANGKADRKALPEPDGSIATGTEYVAPRNETEQKLAAIWQDILQTESIGINDNFFELGGNSLLLVKMHSKLEQERMGGDIKVTDIFANPTISKLADFIQAKNAVNKVLPIKSVQLPQEYFGSELAAGLDETFKFKISDLNKLKLIAENMSIEVEDVLISSFVYLLSQINKSSEIAVQSLLEGDNIYSINVEMSKVKDFPSLFKLVKDIKNSEAEKYKIGDISSGVFKKEPNAVVPLIYKNNLLSVSPELFRVFDIIMEVAQEENYIQFKCSYNGKRLKEEKIKALINGYIKLNQMLANSSK